MFSSRLAASGRNAKIAVALGGALWGLYWLPLRGLDAVGITGAWATLAIYVGSLVLWLPISLGRIKQLIAGGRGLFFTTLIAGISLVLYANSLIFTEVVRAILLFYLTPVWSTLFAWLLLGEAITRLRWISIALGFAGLVVILGIDQGFPLPRNLGDWLALGSGVGWALTAVRLRVDKTNAAEELTTSYLILGSLFAFAMVFIPDGHTGPAPSPQLAQEVIAWFIPVIILIILPSVFLVLWGSRLLNPGLVGILFMTEISIGAGSAALLAGEPFGFREILGVVLISSAGLLESLWPDKRK